MDEHTNTHSRKRKHQHNQPNQRTKLRPHSQPLHQTRRTRTNQTQQTRKTYKHRTHTERLDSSQVRKRIKTTNRGGQKMTEIYNVEDVKNEFLKNILPEYAKTYSRQQIDLSVYFLTDFVNNLVANDLVLLKIEPEPEPEPEPILPGYPQMPQGPPQRMVQRPTQQMQQPQQFQEQQQYYQANPFNEVQDYTDPRTQRMRVDDFRVQQEVAEMNAQLRNPPQYRQPAQTQMQPQTQPTQPQVDVNLINEKNKTFVDKIKDMRNPRKKEGINPEE